MKYSFVRSIPRRRLSQKHQRLLFIKKIKKVYNVNAVTTYYYLPQTKHVFVKYYKFPQSQRIYIYTTNTLKTSLYIGVNLFLLATVHVRVVQTENSISNARLIISSVCYCQNIYFLNFFLRSLSCIEEPVLGFVVTVLQYAVLHRILRSLASSVAQSTNGRPFLGTYSLFSSDEA